MKTIFITSEWVEISYKPLATAKWFVNLAPLGNEFCLLKSSVYSPCIKKKKPHTEIFTSKGRGIDILIQNGFKPLR